MTSEAGRAAVVARHSAGPAPILYWFRRDLRLGDHPGLRAAAEKGVPVIPVFILDPDTETQGAAARWRLALAVEAFAERLRSIGSRLVLRRGPAAEVLRALVRETGAGTVSWTRLYAPETVTRDRGVKAALRRDGVAVQSFPGHVLHEPWAIERGGGGPYRVFTPFWRALASRQVGAELMEVVGLAAPEAWPRSENLADWGMGAGMARGATVVADHVEVGEAAAQARLARFLDGPVDRYKRDRDRLDRDGTSGLSENLTYGEISARSVWNAVAEAATAGASGAEAYLRQLAWRDFAWHLMYHAPEIATRCWRCEWEAFPWREDNDDAERWRRGMTGEPLVDAAMRQLYVTGTMHNRARMVVASYLTKHLLTDWRVGMRWFAECLIDWDPASNALGWQWVAGCGPDAAPYFRVFNPALQAERFDPDGAYRRRFVAELDAGTGAEAAAFFDAVPRRWRLEPGGYPDPLVDLKDGREAALAAYRAYRDAT